MKITSIKELNEQLKAYELEVDSKLTLESVRAKTPREKQITNTVSLPTQYSRHISLKLLQDWINEAKEADADELEINPTVYDGEFEDLEISYTGKSDETEDEYNVRVEYLYSYERAQLIGQKKYDLERAFAEYQKYEELKRRFES